MFPELRQPLAAQAITEQGIRWSITDARLVVALIIEWVFNFLAITGYNERSEFSHLSKEVFLTAVSLPPGWILRPMFVQRWHFQCESHACNAWKCSLNPGSVPKWECVTRSVSNEAWYKRLMSAEITAAPHPAPPQKNQHRKAQTMFM